MKNRARRGTEIDFQLERLNERLTAARAGTKRSAAQHAATRRKLDDLGAQLARLSSEPAAVSAAKARDRRAH